MRLIDADAYAEEMRKRQDASKEWFDESILTKDGEERIRASAVLSTFVVAFLTLEYQPTIDAAPVVHGRWTYFSGLGKGNYQCSECSHWVGAGTAMNYCPHCGAKMDEGDHA